MGPIRLKGNLADKALTLTIKKAEIEAKIKRFFVLDVPT